jgi:hypothetical protein
VLVKGKFVYSGGDKRVIVSNFYTGEVISTITRDSGNIPCLFEKDAELFICSSNGSIRSYALTHNGLNVKLVRKTLFWSLTLSTYLQFTHALLSLSLSHGQ